MLSERDLQVSYARALSLSLITCALQSVCSSNMLIHAPSVRFSVCALSACSVRVLSMCALRGGALRLAIPVLAVYTTCLPHISGLGVSNRCRCSSGGVYQDMCVSLSLSLKGSAFSRLSDCHPRVHMSSFRKPLHFFLRSIGI